MWKELLQREGSMWKVRRASTGEELKMEREKSFSWEAEGGGEELRQAGALKMEG